MKCPVLSQLTQTPDWTSLFSSMDFQLSLRQLVQTCCLALKSMNVVGMSPPRIFCAPPTTCHDLSDSSQLPACAALSVSDHGDGCSSLICLPCTYFLTHHSAVAFCNHQNHAYRRPILQLPSDLFKQHESLITHMLRNRKSFPLLWLFTLERMETC